MNEKKESFFSQDKKISPSHFFQCHQDQNWKTWTIAPHDCNFARTFRAKFPKLYGIKYRAWLLLPDDGASAAAAAGSALIVAAAAAADGGAGGVHAEIKGILRLVQFFSRRQFESLKLLLSKGLFLRSWKDKNM